MFKKAKQVVDISLTEIAALIGNGFCIEGDLTGKSVIRIDGKVTGNVMVEAGVILGETGVIIGNIDTNSAIIYGEVNGNVNAHHLEIKKTGKVNGDIKTETLEIELGAHYNGKLEMNSNVLKQAE